MIALDHEVSVDTSLLFAELNAEREQLMVAHQVNLSNMQQELKSLQVLESNLRQPLVLANEKYRNENQKYGESIKQQVIYAPFDGVVGSVPTKEGELVSSFSTILSVYEENPTLVKGYIHENLIMTVHLGDSLFVNSTLRPDDVISGQAIGLGSRIVEIPGRLRKIPEIKSFGREVLIEIPANNPFLQKEKVMINGSNSTFSKSLFSMNKDSKLEKQLLKLFKSDD